MIQIEMCLINTLMMTVSVTGSMAVTMTVSITGAKQSVVSDLEQDGARRQRQTPLHSGAGTFEHQFSTWNASELRIISPNLISNRIVLIKRIKIKIFHVLMSNLSQGSLRPLAAKRSLTATSSGAFSTLKRRQSGA